MPPIHHIFRVRTTEDLEFLRPGLADELLVNANLLENNPETTVAALRETSLPFAIDPALPRFQVPNWWTNRRGQTKRNYARLAEHYSIGTAIRMAEGPLLQTVATDAEWDRLAANVVEYQRTRLLDIRPQLELFQPRLRPTRIFAPALVAFSSVEDRINRLLADGAGKAAGREIALPVIVPRDRLNNATEIGRVLASVPRDDIGAYFVWTPSVTEDALLSHPDLLDGLLNLVKALADRGVPVGHLHGTYLTLALRRAGIAAIVTHSGWVDKGEPPDPQGGLRSCQTYVPGLHATHRFERARDLGSHLDPAEYVDRYCACAFCAGALQAGQRPLELLLEEHSVPFKNGRSQRTPTGRATRLNTWHWVLSRRLEVEAHSTGNTVDILREDIDRAARLAGPMGTDRLRRVASAI